MRLQIRIDTLTPHLKKIRKRLPVTVAKELTKILKYGKKQAKMYATGKTSATKTGQLAKGIGYRVFKKRGYGYLFSIANGYTTGFPYNLWVNKDIPITGYPPYFGGHNQMIVYGSSGHKSPSGNPIKWRVTPGFMTRANKDMKKKFKKVMSKFNEAII